MSLILKKKEHIRYEAVRLLKFDSDKSMISASGFFYPATFRIHTALCK